MVYAMAASLTDHVASCIMIGRKASLFSLSSIKLTFNLLMSMQTLWAEHQSLLYSAAVPSNDLHLGHLV